MREQTSSEAASRKNVSPPQTSGRSLLLYTQNCQPRSYKGFVRDILGHYRLKELELFLFLKRSYFR